MFSYNFENESIIVTSHFSKYFLETRFSFSILDILKMSIFKNPNRLLKILLQLIDIIDY